MADISDVLTAIGALAGDVLYPTPPGGADDPSPVAHAPVLIQVGWPDPASVDAAVAGGKVLVNLYPRPGERNTTRYPATRCEVAIDATTFALTANGSVVTVSGPPTAVVQNLCVTVDGRPYVVQAQIGATANDVAAALQSLILVDLPGTSVTGAAITVPGGRFGALNVGAFGTVQREVGRQERQIQIMVRAPTPALRDVVTALIDLALRDAYRLPLPDGSVAHLTYHGSPYDDFSQKQAIYRRDLIYAAEYASIATEIAAQIVSPVSDGILPGGVGVNVAFSLDFSDAENSQFIPLF